MERVSGQDACSGSECWPLDLPTPLEWVSVETDVQTGVCPFCTQRLPLDPDSGLLIPHTRAAATP